MRARMLAAIAMLALGPPAEAGSYTLPINPQPDGSTYTGQSTNLPDFESFLIGTQPGFPGTEVGTGNPFWTGTPGVTFPGQWSVGYMLSGAPALININSLSFQFSAAASSPAPETVTVTAPDANVSWTWTVNAAGSYVSPATPFVDDAMVITATGSWQLTSITFGNYNATGLAGPPIPFIPGGTGGGGGGGGTAPEPPSFALLAIAVVCLAFVQRR